MLCDATLRVMGVPDVVAAGTVAKWPDPDGVDGPGRAAHWIAALEQGGAAARTLLHGRNAEPFPSLPLFWSEQRGLRIQICGEIDARAEVEITGRGRGVATPPAPVCLRPTASVAAPSASPASTPRGHSSPRRRRCDSSGYGPGCR